MSELTINALSAAGVAGRIKVTITLTNAAGVQVAGYAPDGQVVTQKIAATDADGILVLEVVPNEDISPANTYYTVKTHKISHLIEQTSVGGTLEEMLAISPADLGLAAGLNALSDVDTTGVADGDTLVWDDASNTWIPGAGGGGAFLGDLAGNTLVDTITGTPVAKPGFGAYSADDTGFVLVYPQDAGAGSGIIMGMVAGVIAGLVVQEAVPDTIFAQILFGGNAKIRIGDATHAQDATTLSQVEQLIADVVDSSPATLDTLNELAAALGDDPNFATTVTNLIATKLASADFTAAAVLALLLGVDGAGSGLDADLVDGNHAAALLARVNHTGPEAVNTVATTGATEDISLNTPVHDLTMDQNCTFSFVDGTDGESITVIVRGAFTPTFPAAVIWPAGTEPTYTTPALYTFVQINGVVWGMQAGKAFA